MYWEAQECSAPGDLGHIHTWDEDPHSSTTSARGVCLWGQGLEKEEARHQGQGLSTALAAGYWLSSACV